MTAIRWREVKFMTVAMAWASVASGADFRLETDIFVGTKKEATVQYLTLFHNDVIYDFRITKPEEVTLFDLPRNRVVLMDPQKKTKATVSTDELLQFAAAIKAKSDETNATFYFAANPNFETSLDDAGEWLTMNGKQLLYRVKGMQPKQADMARRYQEFADWSARLNAVRPGNLPPFARIAVNKAVADKGWIPEEVERSVAPVNFSQRKLEIRARHLPVWTLSELDRKRIEQTGGQLVSFAEIGFSEYLKAAKLATAEPKK